MGETQPSLKSGFLSQNSAVLKFEEILLYRLCIFTLKFIEEYNDVTKNAVFCERKPVFKHDWFSPIIARISSNLL